MPTLRVPSILLVSFALVIVPFLGAVTPSFAHVTASDVVERSTLRTFVERAAALTESDGHELAQRIRLLRSHVPARG